MSTDSHGHGDDTSGYVNPEALQRGHEEDKVDVKSIIYVPLALVATFILAYVVVTLIVNYVRSPSKEAPVNQAAAARNAEPMNRRFERIDSTDASAQVKQPRLEGLQRVEGDTEAHWRSPVPTEDRNPEWFHPEDMRLTSEHARKLGLHRYSWVGNDKNTVQIPVSEAMRAVISAKDPKNPSLAYLPVSSNPLPREELKSNFKPSNPHYGATAGGHTPDHKDHKGEKEPKEPKGKDGKGKEHKD